MLTRFINVLAAAAILTSVLTYMASAAEPVAADPANDADPAWWAEQLKGSGFKPAKRGKEWWRVVVAENPSCAVLSNGCQTCFAGDDRFICSNPGFACIENERWACALTP